MFFEDSLRVESISGNFRKHSPFDLQNLILSKERFRKHVESTDAVRVAKLLSSTGKPFVDEEKMQAFLPLGL